VGGMGIERGRRGKRECVCESVRGGERKTKRRGRERERVREGGEGGERV
jgi:hypothetical protein